MNRQRALGWIADRWTRAATPLKPQELAALYAPDALFFGGVPDHYVGRERIAEYFSFYLGKVAAMTIAFRDHHGAEADVVVSQGFVDFTFLLPDGRTTYASLRGTLVLAPKGKGWEILVHHFSPPPLTVPVPL